VKYTRGGAEPVGEEIKIGRSFVIVAQSRLGLFGEKQQYWNMGKRPNAISQESGKGDSFLVRRETRGEQGGEGGVKWGCTAHAELITPPKSLWKKGLREQGWGGGERRGENGRPPHGNHQHTHSGWEEIGKEVRRKIEHWNFSQGHLARREEEGVGGGGKRLGQGGIRQKK